MSNEFITPIHPMKTIEQLKSVENGQEKGTGTSVFSSVFQNAIKDVENTQNNLEHQQYLLATGQLDDPHNLSIAASEAQLSVDLLVQLRNKAIESYNEIMRISL